MSLLVGYVAVIGLWLSAREESAHYKRVAETNNVSWYMQVLEDSAGWSCGAATNITVSGAKGVMVITISAARPQVQ